MKPFILASASETRARILRSAGVEFEVVPANIDEAKARAECESTTTDQLAHLLAERKACAIAARRRGRYVLGADQVLEFEQEPVGKCATLTDAASLLKRLRGRTHALVTSVVLVRDKRTLWVHGHRNWLVMRKFSNAFLAEYIARAGVGILDAVGCYQIEGLGAQLFEKIEGDVFSILGLPLMPVLAALRARGLVAK